MLKLRKAILCVASSMFILSIPVYASAAGNNDESEASSVAVSTNPYITEYYIEKAANPPSGQLVDPAEEEKVIIATLTDYYNSDIKVAEILSNYDKDGSILEQATSIDKEDKRAILNKVVNVYPKVLEVANQEELEKFLKRYAVDVDVPEAIALLKDIQAQKPQSITPFAAYDGTTAGTWAYNNYNKYDTAFPAFNAGWGSDCTNFVSQALYHGGKVMSGDWYVTKKNSTYLSPASATQLNYSWTLSDPSPWISVSEFYDYWWDKSTVLTYSHDNYVANHTTIYNQSIYKGDVVVFSKGFAGIATMPTHLMIVSDYDTTNKDFKLAGHSNERQAYALLSAIADYSQIEFFEIN